MGIDAVRVRHAALPMRQRMVTAIHAQTHTHNALVEIEADGVVGQGAVLTLSPGQARAVGHMVGDLAEELLGRPTGEVQHHWERMWRRLNLTGQCGIGMLALAALDTALWDLAGKRSGLPLYRLWGGSERSLPVYAQGGWLVMSTEEVAEEACGFEGQGFRHYKMRGGSREWREDVRRVSKVRAALRDDTELLVDANQGWSRFEATQAAAALDDLGLYWLEEPVHALDTTGLAGLRAAIRTPIAAGESVFGTEGFRPMIEARAADVLMPDLAHCGGPTGFLRVAVQADGAGLPVSSHLYTEVSVHLLAVARSAALVEYMPGWWDDLYVEELDIANGFIRPPERAGTGFSFTPQVWEAADPVASL